MNSFLHKVFSQKNNNFNNKIKFHSCSFIEEKVYQEFFVFLKLHFSLFCCLLTNLYFFKQLLKMTFCNIKMRYVCVLFMHVSLLIHSQKVKKQLVDRLFSYIPLNIVFLLPNRPLYHICTPSNRTRAIGR